MSPLLKFKIAVWNVITHLPLLNDEDFLLPTLNLFDSKAEEALIESNKISVFVSNIHIILI